MGKLTAGKTTIHETANWIVSNSYVDLPVASDRVVKMLFDKAYVCVVGPQGTLKYELDESDLPQTEQHVELFTIPQIPREKRAWTRLSGLRMGSAAHARWMRSPEYAQWLLKAKGI